MKLQEPGCLLPGEAGCWRSDLDLRCRLRPISGCGAVLWRLLTESLDVFLLGDTAVLMAGPPLLSVLDDDGDGLYLFQMPFLDLPHSFIHGMVLLLDESFEPDLLPVAGDHKGVGLLRYLRVCTFFYHFAEALCVSNIALLEL